MARAAKFESGVERLTRLYIDAFNHRDVNAMLEMYAPDALLLLPRAAAVTGRSAIRAILETVLQSGLSQATVQNTQLHNSDDDNVVEIGEYAMQFGESHDPSKRESGKFVLSYARQPNGEFRISSAVWSSDPKHP